MDNARAKGTFPGKREILLGEGGGGNSNNDDIDNNRLPKKIKLLRTP